MLCVNTELGTKTFASSNSHTNQISCEDTEDQRALSKWQGHPSSKCQSWVLAPGHPASRVPTAQPLCSKGLRSRSVTVCFRGGKANTTGRCLRGDGPRPDSKERARKLLQMDTITIKT